MRMKMSQKCFVWTNRLIWQEKKKAAYEHICLSEREEVKWESRMTTLQWFTVKKAPHQTHHSCIIFCSSSSKSAASTFCLHLDTSGRPRGRSLIASSRRFPVKNSFFSSDVVWSLCFRWCGWVVALQEELCGSRGSCRHIIHLHLKPETPKCFKPPLELFLNIICQFKC